jgi:hypothetical protein
MENVNLFEVATRKKFRFPSSKGDLNIEQLWELDLKSRNGFDLDSVAKAVNKELKGETEESFVNVTPNPKQKPLEQKLELVKYIIGVKMEEEKKAKDRAARKEKREKILAAIANKQDAQLQGASLEDLQKELAALDGE